MHLKGKFVKKSFEEKNIKEMGKWTEDMILKNGPNGPVCPHPGAI